jgi:hypothetical protein
MIAVENADPVAADVMLLVSNGFIQTQPSARRASKLFPGARLVHGDFHNHTLLSDGLGHPELAFESMHRAGLDVAAVTDHALYPADAPIDDATRIAKGYVRSLSSAGWQLLGDLTAQAHRDE